MKVKLMKEIKRFVSLFFAYLALLYCGVLIEQLQPWWMSLVGVATCSVVAKEFYRRVDE